MSNHGFFVCCQHFFYIETFDLFECGIINLICVCFFFQSILLIFISFFPAESKIYPLIQFFQNSFNHSFKVSKSIKVKLFFSFVNRESLKLKTFSYFSVFLRSWLFFNCLLAMLFINQRFNECLTCYLNCLMYMLFLYSKEKKKTSLLISFVQILKHAL